MKKYHANYSVNNGTSLMNSLEGDDAKKLAEMIKRMCKEERFAGNTGMWWVKDEDGQYVYGGVIDRNGRNHNGAL